MPFIGGNAVQKVWTLVINLMVLKFGSVQCESVYYVDLFIKGEMFIYSFFSFDRSLLVLLLFHQGCSYLISIKLEAR